MSAVLKLHALTNIRITQFPTISKQFHQCCDWWGHWWGEIFNFYDHRVTNAYTESTNRLAKDMDRMGRGYSFEVIRARLIYEKQARKPTTKVRGRKQKSFLPEKVMYRFSMADENVKAIEYGPHIPTLCDLLEKGCFS